MILHVTPRYRPLPRGGAERQLERLAPKLAAKGLRVAVLTWDAGQRSLPSFEILDGVSIYRLRERWLPFGGKRRLPGLWMGITLLGFLLKRYRKVRFVHVHAFTELAAFAKLWCGFLGICCAAKATGLESIHCGVRARRGWVGRMLWRVMTGSGWTIAMSRAIADALHSSGVPDNRILLLRNGVEAPHEVPSRGNRSAEALLIVASSSLIRVKRLDLLIAAVAILGREFPNLRWVVAGDGPERLRLEDLCRARAVGNIHWSGMVEDVHGLLSHADIFVHPSECEGMSNSVLEAMAYGLPVVVRRADFHRELVTEGETGLMFDGTEHDLAGRIRELVLDEGTRIRLGQNAHAFIARRYSFEVACREYVALLAELGVYGRSPGVTLEEANVRRPIP